MFVGNLGEVESVARIWNPRLSLTKQSIEVVPRLLRASQFKQPPRLSEDSEIETSAGDNNVEYGRDDTEIYMNPPSIWVCHMRLHKRLTHREHKLVIEKVGDNAQERRERKGREPECQLVRVENEELERLQRERKVILSHRRAHRQPATERSLSGRRVKRKQMRTP